jgi:hypothetical protein
MFPDNLFFVFFFIIVAVSIVLTILRVIGFGRRGVLMTTPDGQQPVREREIIREIVKVRCPYCGNLYDETEDKCPHCGGTKT